MILGFQMSSYAQIVNLGLAVFPEHVTSNLASLFLTHPVWSHEPTELPENFEHFGNFGFGMLKIVI
jgi:hypothetical protein